MLDNNTKRKVYKKEQIMDYMNSPWFYNLKYNSKIPVNERTVKSCLYETANVFLQDIYDVSRDLKLAIMSKRDLLKELDKRLDLLAYTPSNSEILSAINLLTTLYDYAWNEELNIVAFGDQGCLNIVTKGTVSVPLPAVAQKNDRYYLFYPLFERTIDPGKLDSDFEYSLDWHAAKDFYSFDLHGILFYDTKHKKTYPSYRDYNSFIQTKYILGNVIKGIRSKIFFPIREETSKSRFIKEISRFYLGPT